MGATNPQKFTCAVCDTTVRVYLQCPECGKCLACCQEEYTCPRSKTGVEDTGAAAAAK